MVSRGWVGSEVSQEVELFSSTMVGWGRRREGLFVVCVRGGVEPKLTPGNRETRRADDNVSNAARRHVKRRDERS